MRSFTRGLYAVFGVMAVAAGVAAQFWPQLALPPSAYSPITAHLTREEGALVVFVGLMMFWCLRHYEIRRPVHMSLLASTAIFAGIHVWGFIHNPDYFVPVLANLVPVTLLAVTAPWSTREP